MLEIFQMKGKLLACLRIQRSLLAPRHKGCFMGRDHETSLTLWNKERGERAVFTDQNATD